MSNNKLKGNTMNDIREHVEIIIKHKDYRKRKEVSNAIVKEHDLRATL